VQCPNPTHDTTKHHFQVNTKKPWVHCFAGCGISGTYEHAIAIIEGVDEREARRIILRASRHALDRAPAPHAGEGTRKTATDEAVERDKRMVESGEYFFLPKLARGYLADRGIEGHTRGKWKIGWDEEEERLVIPVYDANNRFRFCIRHRVDGVQRGKYLYTDGAIKTSLLFGACYLDLEQVHSIGLILCEGPLDVIRLHQLGFRNAVAILGTGISKAQVRIIDKIGPKRIYLFFDRDSAGVANIEMVAFEKKPTLKGDKLFPSPIQRKYPLWVCLYPKDKGDPAEMTRREVERSIERAITLAKFNRKARSAKLTRKVATIG
jgi:DNA primase